LEQSHHHEVHGSYWVTPCLRIVGPLRCRIWSTLCTSYFFFSGPHSFPTHIAQYSRPCRPPPIPVVTFCPSLPAGSHSFSSSYPIPISSFSPPTCTSFSSFTHTSGCCSSSIFSSICSCPPAIYWSSSPSSLCCSSYTSSPTICFTTLKPVPRPG